MKKTKILALLMSMAMLSSTAMPGTLAISSDVDDGTPEYACDFEEHQHDEYCWETELTCTEGEIEGHTHGDGCYSIETVTICNLEEEPHEHSDECPTEEKETLTCEEPETEGHVHGEGCYGEAVLVCTTEEHIHTDECYPAEEADVCEFCGVELTEDGVHEESCDLYEEPEEEIIVIDGPQIGERIWINSGSVVYQTKNADDGWTLWGNYEVEITDIITDNNGNAVMYEFKFTSVGVGEWLLHNYKYVKVENTSEEEPDEAIEDVELVNDTYGVTVTGELPAGIELSVEEASVEDVINTAPELEYLCDIENEALVYDISLLPAVAALSAESEEIQPENPVTVTMDVSEVAEEGEDVIVYHVHENEDGTVETELRGPFTVQDDKISFEMTRFSYVLVLNSSLKIEGVDSFYPVSSYVNNGTFPESTNGNWCIVGVYYDAQQNGHVLIGQISNNIGRDKVRTVSVNGTPFPNNDTNLTIYDGSITEITREDTGAELVKFVTAVNAIWDLNIGNLPISQTFTLSLDSKAGGFDIEGMEINLHLEYTIVKTVAPGTSAGEDVNFFDSITVDRGDWVIYKIEVNNTGTVPLTGMKVTDVLPSDVFDMDTVQMSIDLTGETNWQPFNEIMFNNYSSEGEFTNTLYIRAQVLPNLNITDNTTYTNTAMIDGMNMPTVSDSANIVVNAPKTGTLTISKAVTSENPNDPAPDTEFTFTIHSDADSDAEVPFSYTKSDGTTGSVANDDTFTLKNGESIEFTDFPVGGFTVTETVAAGYTTKVNGSTGVEFEGTMVGDGSPVVAFENQFSTRYATLSITKIVDKEYTGDILPDDTFEFTVSFGDGDGTDTTTGYSYTIDEISAGTIVSGGIIKLAGGQTAVITGIPVGLSYTVTETLDEDYTTVVNGEVNNTVTGTTVFGENSVVNFVNTYKRHTANLTITKEAAQGETFYPGESFIFNVTGGDLEGKTITVVINGTGSVTIEGLTLGQKYTVTEDESWSYRYDADYAEQDVTLVADDQMNTVTFTNTKSTTNTKWLYSEAYCQNIFSDNTITPNKDNED